MQAINSRTKKVNSNYLKLYLDDVFSLAKTLTIKSNYSAEKINADLAVKYGKTSIDFNDKTSWKYYLNICGEYHPSDTPMYVTSLDTLQSIVFNKENLLRHPATRSGYNYNSRYYKELLERYPDQEMLILGILYPAKMEHAIQAVNYSVLAYNPELVEPQEEDLFRKINFFTTTFEKRWRINGFNYTQNLYEVSFFNTLCQMLTPTIVQLRNEAIGTHQAHSFLVRMHLASHQGLDEFIPYMTDEQRMWLYRNISYIENNPGTKDTFDKLIANILTARGIPVKSWDLVHISNNLLEGKEHVKPQVAFESKYLNQQDDTRHIALPSVIQNKLINKADGNAEYELLYPTAVDDFSFALSNRVKTKVLETTPLTLSEGTGVSEIDHALSLWVHASASNNFNVYTRINHPDTGAEITMSALDAYYVFLYAYAKSVGSNLEKIPLLIADNAPTWPVPSRDQIESLVVEEDVPVGFVDYVQNTTFPQKTFINLVQFQQAIPEMASAYEKALMVQALPQNITGKSSAVLVMDLLWSEKVYHLNEVGQDTQTYFQSKLIDLGTMSQEQWSFFYKDLFTAVTGLKLESIEKQNDTHKAMVSIMERLLSYNTIFVSNSSSSVVKSIYTTSLLIEENKQSDSTVYTVPIFSLEAILKEQQTTHVYDVEVCKTHVKLSVDYEEVNELWMGGFIEQVQDTSQSETTLCIHHTSIKYIDPITNEESDEIAGMDEALETIPFSDIPNIYETEHEPVIEWPGPIDPGDILIRTSLELFKPIPKIHTRLGDFNAFSSARNTAYFTNKENIIVLDGIYSSKGEDELDVFASNVGPTTIKSFKYDHPEDTSVNAWTYSAGNALADVFNLADFSKDVLQLPSISKGFVQTSISTKAAAFSRIFRLDFFQRWALSNYQIQHGFGQAYITFKHVFDNLTMPSYEKGFAFSRFNFKHFLEPIVMTHFTHLTKSFRLENFRGVGSVYYMLDSRPYIAQSAFKLRQYPLIEAVDFDDGSRLSIGGGVTQMQGFTTNKLTIIEIGDVADPAVVTP